jgi:hypothetical protein
LKLMCVCLLAGCATAASAHRFHGDRFSVTFPAAPSARRADEGPLARAHIARAVDADDCVHEAAVFTFPQALDADQQQRLMARVERGLGARPDARGAKARTMPDGARQLTIELDGGLVGRWLLFYPEPNRMVQLSVLGPESADVPAKSRVFFESFDFDAR